MKTIFISLFAFSSLVCNSSIAVNKETPEGEKNTPKRIFHMTFNKGNQRTNNNNVTQPNVNNNTPGNRINTQKKPIPNVRRTNVQDLMQQLHRQGNIFPMVNFAIPNQNAFVPLHNIAHNTNTITQRGVDNYVQIAIPSINMTNNQYNIRQEGSCNIVQIMFFPQLSNLQFPVQNISNTPLVYNNNNGVVDVQAESAGNHTKNVNKGTVNNGQGNN